MCSSPPAHNTRQVLHFKTQCVQIKDLGSPFSQQGCTYKRLVQAPEQSMSCSVPQVPLQSWPCPLHPEGFMLYTFNKVQTHTKITDTKDLSNCPSKILSRALKSHRFANMPCMKRPPTAIKRALLGFSRAVVRYTTSQDAGSFMGRVRGLLVYPLYTLYIPSIYTLKGVGKGPS